MKYLPNQTSFIDDEDFTQKKEKCNQCGKTATDIFADESLCNNCQGVAKLVRDKADAEKGAMSELKVELAEKDDERFIVIDDEQKTTFAKELANLLNKHSIENESDTPDWILAEYIKKILEAWNSSVLQRDKWYGHKTLTRENHS